MLPSTPLYMRPEEMRRRNCAALLEVTGRAGIPRMACPRRRKTQELMHKIANAIVARGEEIAFVWCVDTGQVLKFTYFATSNAACPGMGTP